MPEMAEQRAVKFAQLATYALALGVVGFRDIERDQAVVVPGHHRRASDGGVGIEKIECQRIGVFVLCVERQAELQQRVEQPMLGRLDEAPAPEILGLRQIGNGAVVPAGDTKLIGLIRRDQPIAGLVHRVLAKTIAYVVPGQRLPLVPGGAQRRNGLLPRQIPEPRTATLAPGVLEIQRLAAILAFEQLH